MISVRYLSVACLSALALTATGCPKGLGLPGTGSSKVDPNTCGNYAVSDAGRKLHAFLDATAKLETTVNETASVIRTSCTMMGNKLQMNAAELKGETNDVCARVFTRVRDNMKVSLKADAKLNVVYKPAVCTVDIQASAHAAAECEGKADADVNVTCEGTCSGTCNGTCAGTCSGGNAGGKCNGQCSGQCNGSCTGGCDGNAKVDASAQCRASAEVNASANVTCTKAELTVEADAKMVVDTSKAEMTLAALREGLPEIFSVEARLKPLQASIEGWATAAGELSRSAGDISRSFKDQALCISGQIAAAVGMVTNIKASVNVSVSVTASAHGSIGSK
jgi:hypothetical protein